MKKHLIFFLCFLAGFIIGLYVRSGKNVVQKVVADTVTDVRCSIRVDTFTKYCPVPYVCKTLDTVRLPAINDSCYHVVEQKEYKDSLYDIWVSGCLTSLDSVKVFGRTEYIERTNTITQTKTVYDTKAKLYLGAGVQRYEKNYIPSITLYCSKKDFLIGVMAGLFDNKPIYGVNVNYKIK